MPTDDSSTAAPPSGSRSPGLVRRLLPLLFFAVFTFGLLEVGSYAYLRMFQGYDGEHLMNYEFDPYKNIRLTPNFRDTRGIQHNSQGFRRSEETPRQKPPGTLRIFVMGGSTGYGLHSLSRYGAQKYPIIRNDETIDHFLESYLRERIHGIRVEVINAAITSFCSHHHLIYLNQTILKFDPDMIIFIDGFNDYFNYSDHYDQFRDYAYKERVHAFMAEPSLSAWLQYTGWWLFRKSHAFHLAGLAARKASALLRQDHHGERQVIDLDAAIANLRVNAENNFAKMVERNGLILAREGVTAIFTLQPEIAFEQSKSFSPLEQQIYGEMENLWAENFIEFKNRARPVVIDYLKQATQSTGAHFVDLTDPFGGTDGDCYTDYCHLTPLGDRVLAEYLGEQILPLVRQRAERVKAAAAAASVAVAGGS